METRLVGELLAWVVFLVGGFLTVFVILMTEANLSGAVIREVLLPGIVVGLLLMGFGAYGAHRAKRG